MVFIFIYPQEVIGSVKDGLLLWYNSVLPSVFPFLAASNILISIGAISKLGRIVTPVMKPLFNIPGSGAFAIAMGGVSGYPVGGKITADLREAGKLTRDEAQRLISFCNNGGPVFITGAVGTAILGSVKAGYFILATNCISALIVGLIFRFYKSSLHGEAKYPVGAVRKGEPQPFGRIFSLSVVSAIETVVQIGGFILIFGAFITIFRLSGLLYGCEALIGPIFSAIGLDTALCGPFVGGMLEITNGVKMIGELSLGFKEKVLLSGFLVSFGGFSIFAQTVSFISKTDISALIYLLSKILQAAIQVLTAACLYDLFF